MSDSDSGEIEGSWRDLTTIEVSPAKDDSDSDTHSDTDYGEEDVAEYEFGDGGGIEGDDGALEVWKRGAHWDNGELG